MPDGKNIFETKADLIRALRAFSKLNGVLIDEKDLYDASREIFLRAGILDKFDPTNPAGVADMLEKMDILDIPKKEQETTPEAVPKTMDQEVKDAGPRALNSQDLKVLLDEYDKHRSLQEAEKIAAEIQKHPLLKKVDSKDILAAVLRKTQIEADVINKGKTASAADRASDDRLLIEKKLAEARVEEASSKVTDRDIEILAEKIVLISEEKFDPETSRSSTQEAIGKLRTDKTIKEQESVEVVQKIVEMVDGDELVKESNKDVIKVLDELKISGANVRAEAVKIAAQVVAKEVVEEQIEATAEYVAVKVENVVEENNEERQLSDKQITAIERAVEKRVQEKLLEKPTVDINHHEAITSKEGSQKTVETGPTLVEEIEDIIGIPLSSEEKVNIEMAVRSGDTIATKVILQGSDPKTGLVEKSGGKPTRFVPNERNMVDICRSADLEERIVGRMVASGESMENARNAAKYVVGIHYPTGEPSTSVSEFQIENVLNENNFGQENGPSQAVNNQAAAEYSKILKGFIRSPVPIRENVEKAIKLGEKLRGIPEADRLKTVANMLMKNDGRLLKSMEYIQKLVHFQDKIAQISGGISNPLGYILRIPAVQEFSVQIATKFGGQMMGAMATHIAKFGLEQGVKNIVGQMFTQGTVTAVKLGVQAGTKVVAQTALTAAGTVAVDGAAAATAATGVGIPIALILLAAQIIYTVGKKVIGFVKNKVGKLLADLGLVSGEFKNWLQDTFGIGGKGILDTTVKLLLFGPILIGAAFAAAITLVQFVVPMVIGLMMAMQFLHANQVSSLVAPIGVGDLNCIKKSDIGATGGGILANCNINAPVTNAINVEKSRFVNVAERWRTGGALNAQRCFYDVVCRAKNAGVNPDFALWAWLHESGASNYQGFAPTEIEDFGIHNAPGVSKNNFDQQASFFMPYIANGGIEHCVGNPLITAAASGRDAYWLAVATYYLNGNCDPNFENPVSGGTGWDYLAEMKTTWSWINSAEMPDSAKISPQSCGGGTSTTTETTDTTGTEYICEPKTEDPMPGSEIPGDPIYDENCEESPAYCVVAYLLHNGVRNVTCGNSAAAARLITQWQNPPPGFNKNAFNSAMRRSACAFGAFQCVGFAVGLDTTLGSPAWGGTYSSWLRMIAQGSAHCPRINNRGAGVGDFVLFPTGNWFHIVIISRLRPDGSYSISQANWGSPGQLSNVNGSNLQRYLVGKSVLRCR
jgi:hypothetical protein